MLSMTGDGESTSEGRLRFRIPRFYTSGDTESKGRPAWAGLKTASPVATQDPCGDDDRVAVEAGLHLSTLLGVP
jgi:hypothetical protein